MQLSHFLSSPIRLGTRRRLTAGLLAVGLATGFGGLAEGLGPDRFSTTNFRTQAVRPDGSIDWRLHGKTAVSSGPQVDVTGLRMLVYREGDPVLITCDTARIDRVRNIATSNQPVHVRSSTMVADGVGFELDSNDRILTVRQQVHVTFYELDPAALDAAAVEKAKAADPGIGTVMSDPTGQ